MNKQALIPVAVLACLLFLCGCNGVVRYKILGFRKSATVEFYRGSPAWLVPAAALGGAVTDLSIAVLDTAANPFCGLWMVALGPDPRDSVSLAGILLLPINLWMTPIAMAVIPMLPEESYAGIFGNGSRLFEPPAEELRPSSQPEAPASTVCPAGENHPGA